MGFCTNCVNEYAWRPTDNPFPKECKECEVIDGKPSNFKPKHNTNADRIRAMSDEELAVWMTSIRLDTINEMCKKFDVEIEMPVPTVENTADVCEWLKQPAEVDSGQTQL